MTGWPNAALVILALPAATAALLAALPSYRLSAALNVGSAFATFLASASLLAVTPPQVEALVTEVVGKLSADRPASQTDIRDRSSPSPTSDSRIWIAVFPQTGVRDDQRQADQGDQRTVVRCIVGQGRRHEGATEQSAVAERH